MSGMLFALYLLGDRHFPFLPSLIYSKAIFVKGSEYKFNTCITVSKVWCFASHKMSQRDDRLPAKEIVALNTTLYHFQVSLVCFNKQVHLAMEGTPVVIKLRQAAR